MTGTNKDTARRAIEELDRRHEPAEEFYTEDSMAYMLKGTSKNSSFSGVVDLESG